MKPIKRGYKLWSLADNDEYIYKFDVYVRNDINGNKRKEYGLGGDVVVRITDHLENMNHRIYFDNFFSSIPLCEYLQAHGILACGTIRSNRKDVPTLVADKQMKRGEFDFRSTSGGISVYKWMDSKVVYFISNFHGVNDTAFA